MELAELIRMQRRFDDRRGWNIGAGSDAEMIALIAKDLVGLVGEIGEFANLLKKIQLQERFPARMVEEFDRRRSELSEEIIDALIYLIRISGHLNLDVEKVYLEKLHRNEEKYRDFEQKT